MAAGIQLLHDFTLVHDDIEDNSDLRRSRPTVWKLWGLAQGINTGDGMFAIAHLAVHRMAELGVDPALVLEVLRRFDQTILRICEGQFLDLSFEGNLNISEDDYLAMISRKTAVLVAACCELGALVGGADARTTQALFDFGQNLGLAFQMQDDVLGIWGDPEITGKPAAADLIQRKLSLPIIHALHTAEQRDTLAAIYSKKELHDGDIGRLLDVLDQAGTRAYTEQIAASYSQRAQTALATVQGDPGAKEALHGLVDRLIGREV